MKNPILVGSLFIICLGISIIACKAAAPTGFTDQDRAAIRKVSEDGLKMINTPEKDFEAFVKLYYTEDAMSLAPNEPAIQGRANQIAWYKAFPPFELREDIVELEGRGDLAYARLTGTVKVTMPDATEPIVDTIKGMEIWKRQNDGSWKVSCDVWNSDLPIKAQTPAQTETGSVEQELIKLENGWVDALVKRDVAFLDRILADDFMTTSSRGIVSTKAQIVASLKSGEYVFTSAILDDINVRIYGDVAIVTGRNTVKSTRNAKDISGQERWTDTWIKRDGPWQAVATHNSMIAQK